MEQVSNGLDNVLIKVGEYLRKKRLETDQKILSVSLSVGISHSVISKIENGKYKGLSLKLLLKLIRHYDTPFEDFFYYMYNDNKYDFVKLCNDLEKNFNKLNKSTVWKR